jgi:hypothetical protein
MSFEQNQSNPLELKHGSTWNQRFYWIQKSNNQPVNLTGCSASMAFMESRSKDIVLTISTDDSPETMTIDGVNGIITINVDTSELTENKSYQTDIKVIFPGNIARYTDTIYVNILKSIS